MEVRVAGLALILALALAGSGEAGSGDAGDEQLNEVTGLDEAAPVPARTGSSTG